MGNFKQIACLALLTAGRVLAEPVVEIDIAIVEMAASTVDVSGIVVSREDALISSELEGRLTWVADVGDRILAGDLLATLDGHLLELEQRDARADIARLQANLAWLERQSERLEKLALTNNTAQSELDEVQSRHAMLVQEIRIANIELERRNYDIARSRVVAPFDGVVVARELSTGEYAQVGQPLLRLVNTAAAEVSVTAPLHIARAVSEGDSVLVFNGDRSSVSPVRSLIPVGDTRSHMMELRVSLVRGDWMIGEPVSVALPDTPLGELITVTRDALVLRDRQTYVFTVDDAAVAHRVPVTVGRGNGARIAVEGEVKAGDRVVIRGAERLREGQTVEILEQRLSVR
jgi:RND family efflux transporter MFP subunit